MRPGLKLSIAAIVTAIVGAMLWIGTRSVLAQSPAQSPLQGPNSYKAPRTPDGQPDLNGFWQALNTAYWDIEEHGSRPAPYPELVGAYLAQPAGFSIVEGGAIPYKPQALAKRKQFLENRLKADPLLLDNLSAEDMADPEAKCFQGGVPRSTYIPLPMQIVQSRNKILMAYEFGPSMKVIHVGQDMAKERAALLNIDSWMGQSVGRWDGETLVVDTRWFSGTIWLDRVGNHFSMNANVVERYTPLSPYHLKYEATITDPDVFTRPWTLSMPLYRRIDLNMELLEFECIPYAEPLMYDKLKRPGK